MRTYEELKGLLTEVKNNNFDALDGIDVDSVLDDMLRFIGRTDAEFRDDLIYMTFLEWGEYKGLISSEKARDILKTCLSDTHLFHGIGESGTDSVFTRSFSVLLLPVLFCMHNENPFLTADDIGNTRKTVVRYASLEKDFRGFVDGKGWAHAVAHTADALSNITACEIDDELVCDRDAILEILEATKSLVSNRELVFATNEDDRLAEIFYDAGSSEILTHDELIAWLDSFGLADNGWRKNATSADRTMYANRKNFMRAVYFRMMSDSDHEAICKHIMGYFVN